MHVEKGYKDAHKLETLLHAWVMRLKFFVSSFPTCSYAILSHSSLSTGKEK